MENQSKLVEGVERLTENEKLELFKVEELETRLEMAAAAPGEITNGACVSFIFTW